MKIKETEKMLRYTFSREELLEIGKKLAEANGRKVQIDCDQKRVVSDFKAQAAKADSEIGSLSQNISSGYDLRMVKCSVDYNSPCLGKKTITRLDTFETVEVLEMTQDEMQEELPLSKS